MVELRADAERNRRRLLEVARAALTSGAEKVTLESIARDAGVGIGTLYRHFPTRDALVEAVYRSELDGLCARVDDLLAAVPPADALRAWMDAYADFVSTKRGMAEALRAAVAAGAITSAQTRLTLATAADRLLKAGARAGSLRSDVRADDLVASLAGALLVAGGPEQREQLDRILDLLMAGVRTTTPRARTRVTPPRR